MGLRPTASVNESDATIVIMAPALTEPTIVNQTKLTSSTSNISPTVSTTVSPRLTNNNLSTKEFLSKGAFQLAFEKHISDGPNTGPEIKLHMDEVSNSVTDKKHEEEQSSPNVNEQQYYTTINNNNHQNVTINNNTTTMGLQKERDKENAEMEQMLGELASTSDIDLLQVFKSLESAPAGDGLCDLASGLSLFNDVDVMNICSVVEDVTTPNKDSDTLEVRIDIEKRQAQMQRKCDFLLRRLRKIQSRHMGQHINEEVGELFGDVFRLYKRKEREHQKLNNYEENHSTANTSSFITQNQSALDKTKPISMHAMKTFLKKINHVSATQSASLAKRNQLLKTNNDVSSSNKVNLVTLIPEIDDKAAGKLENVAGSLQTELRMVETAIDSDATASSSGGESADENITYNNTTQEPLCISKRAAWRWARDRAAVASRWSWLLAQISDLEYRIRQHNELHLQIKKNKGAVSFEDSTPIQQPPQQSVNGYRGILPGNNKPIETDITPNGTIDPGLLNNSSRTRPFQRNGFRKRKLLQTVNLHTISKKAARPSSVKCGCQWPLHPCALCTGRQDPTAPRDLPDMMPASERVALLDTSFHPVLSFPEDVSQSIHFEAIMRLPEWQNKAKRTTTKSSLKGAMAAQKAAEKEDRAKKFIDGRRKYSKKFGLVNNKLKKTNSRRALHGKFAHLIKPKHRKVSGSQAPSSGSDTAIHQMDLEHVSGSTVGTFSLPRSKTSSPTPTGSSNLNHKNDRSEIRKSRNSYDIDNIVIPYSVAASTRVELLPYKEIPTPKWRIIEAEGLDEEVEKEEKEKNIEHGTSQEIEEEDRSGEAISQKHDRALLEERKKFSTFLKFPWSTRSRANRRTDSRAESSGANTPDPPSPAPTAQMDNESIPSPAQTLIGQANFDGVDNPEISSTSFTPNNIQPISGNNGKRPIERRRTVSLKLAKEREMSREECRRSNTPDVREVVIPPYDPLEFPLSECFYEEMLKSMPVDHKSIIKNFLQLNSELLNNEQDDDMGNNILNDVEHNITIAATTIAEENLENIVGSDEDTESIDSLIPDEDPNDPEWQSTKNPRSVVFPKIEFPPKHLTG